jgi:hypothetical protein
MRYVQALPVWQCLLVSRVLRPLLWTLRRGGIAGARASLHDRRPYFFPYFSMSVFVLSPVEFAAIAATLRIARDGFRRPIFPLSMAERWEHKVLVEPIRKQDEEQYALSLIEPFVFRLYLANAMAERYTYMKDATTEFVIAIFELPRGKVLPLTELLSLLGSLRYNLVTNGGNTFLGVKDDEKLKELIENIKTELIRGREAA